LILNHIILEHRSTRTKEWRRMCFSEEISTTPAPAPSRHVTPSKNIFPGGRTSTKKTYSSRRSSFSSQSSGI